MYKNTILILLIAVLLTACTAKTGDIPAQGGQTTVESQIATESPAQPAEKSWVDAYIELLSDTERLKAPYFFPRWIKLIDVDFCGIPELFILDSFQAPYIGTGFTYHNGEIFDMTFSGTDGFALPGIIELCRNRETSDLVWIGFDHHYMRAGAAVYFTWCILDFGALPAVSTMDLWACRAYWQEPQSPDGSLTGFYDCYTNENGNEDKVTVERMIERMNEVIDDYEFIQSWVDLIGRPEPEDSDLILKIFENWENINSDVKSIDYALNILS